MLPFKIAAIILLFITQASSFWEFGTTTVRGERTDTTPRVSFFRWQWVYLSTLKFWFWWYDWYEIEMRRRLNVVAGISIDLLPLSTAAILNRRVLITSYNYIDPYINRQTDLRIWALGRTGMHNTPYRYRVYRVHRLVPISGSPEHCHGPRCTHQPRHDVTIIISHDQMYLYPYPPHRYHYAYRSFVAWKYHVLYEDLWSAGSGYEYLEHIYENYKIFYSTHSKQNIVDCSKYLPKYWGKFICIRNVQNYPGIQNGGPLFSGTNVVGLGAFTVTYNEDRIIAFTDLRYYYTKIYHYAYLRPGQYYEYAYPQWGVALSNIYDGGGVSPYIPAWQVRGDFYPMGKK